jgi:hypothetical protein
VQLDAFLTATRHCPLNQLGSYCCPGASQGTGSAPPDLIAGPWESVGASGIDGIFFHIETGSSGPAERQQTAWQTVDIRVYHRQGGMETAGWFATSDQATSKSNNTQDQNAFIRLDADRLQIHFPSAPGSLHIRESSDGFLSAWLNRTISGTDPPTRSVQSDQRSGEPLRVVSAIGDEIILETSFAMGPTHRYRGNLSEGNRVLAGTWEDAGSGTLKAPGRFRRVP